MKALHTELAPAAIGPYSQAINVNGFIFASGQLPIDPATGELAEGGIKSELGIRPCAKIPQPTATLRTMPTDIKGYLHPPVAVVAGLASPFEQRVLVVDEQFALHGEGRRDAQVEKAATVQPARMRLCPPSTPEW